MINPCCCMSLRTGALVIGILEIVLYGLGVLLYGLTVSGLAYAHGKNSTALATHLEHAQATDSNPVLQTDVNGIFIFLSLMTILCFIQTLVGIVLVVGVKKSSLLLLKCWLAVKVLVVMLSVILLGVSICNAYSDLAGIFSDALACLISVYFFYVVYTLTLELKKGGSGLIPHGSFKF